jgi:hypothetical protein
MDNNCSGCDGISSVLAIASLVAIVLNIWNAALNFVVSTNVWWFVLAFVVFGSLKKKTACGSCFCGRESKTSVALKAPVRKKAKKKRK